MGRRSPLGGARETGWPRASNAVRRILPLTDHGRLEQKIWVLETGRSVSAGVDIVRASERAGERTRLALARRRRSTKFDQYRWGRTTGVRSVIPPPVFY